MATTDLTGRRVLAIVTNYGVEQDELVVPARALREAGATVVVAAQSTEPVETLVGDKDPGESVRPDTTIDEADAADFDLLLVPGGTINADTIRQDDGAVSLLKAFASAGPDIGSPVLEIEGAERGVHGPIIDDVPELAESLTIWDAVVPLVRSRTFFEVKRGRG